MLRYLNQMGEKMKKKLLPILIIGLFLAGTAGIAGATTIDYALLSEGAAIESVSSQYPGSGQTARDNLLRSTKDPWLWNGETGFIFANGDSDQTIVLDLGANRLLDRIGANFIPPTGDREVWDYFGISISLDNSSYTSIGSLGTKGDSLTDVTSSPYYFNLNTTTLARYIQFEFGEHSPDHGGGGSRVIDLYALGNTVPEPATIMLFGIGLLGIAGVSRRKTK